MIMFIVVSRHLIDFHLSLLKRISLGKGAKRDKFVSILTKVNVRSVVFTRDTRSYFNVTHRSSSRIVSITTMAIICKPTGILKPKSISKCDYSK
jgi:hypothetical protein